jgi:hypothetical protein
MKIDKKVFLQFFQFSFDGLKVWNIGDRIIETIFVFRNYEKPMVKQNCSKTY